MNTRARTGEIWSSLGLWASGVWSSGTLSQWNLILSGTLNLWDFDPVGPSGHDGIYKTLFFNNYVFTILYSFFIKLRKACYFVLYTSTNNWSHYSFANHNLNMFADLCRVVLSTASRNRFLVESMTTRATSFVTGPHLISHNNKRISSH